MPEATVRPRRVWVDSGPAGTSDPGERIIAFVAEGWLYEEPFRASLPTSRTTASMTNFVNLDVPPPLPGMKSYMDGFEGSDLVGVYYALDRLGEIDEGQAVEVLGDGRVFD